MNDHPTAEELAGFVWNRVPSGRAHAIVSHLLHGCEACQSAVAPHLAGLLGTAEPPECLLSPAEEAEYDAALDQTLASAFQFSQEREEDEKLATFSALSDAESGDLSGISPDLQGAPLFEALLELSWSLRHENPERMVRIAEWARILAERLDPGELGAATMVDLQCRAWVELGNAYRAADELANADQALGKATQLYLRGTQDELLGARLFVVQASIFSARRLFAFARTSLDLVFAIYLRHGEQHLAGRALIMKGILGYNGETEDALATLEKGLGLIQEDREPKLILAAIQNRARLLADCGRFRDARIALWTLKARRLDAGGRLNELKIRWLEGQINAGLGELDRAETALQEVMLGFEEAGLPYKAALAGLELGLVMFRRGNADAAIQEVLAAVHVFLSLGIAREVSASVLLLRKAIDRELLSLEFLEYVIERLRRAEDGREVFEPTMDE